MRPYFTSEKQKQSCLKALSDAITLWEHMDSCVMDKRAALRACIRDGSLPEGYKPMNLCPLCEYAKVQTDSQFAAHLQKALHIAGINCRAFCPVVWDPVKNPGNRDVSGPDSYYAGPDAPCMASGPYRDWIETKSDPRLRLCPTPKEPLANNAMAVFEMVTVLKQTLKNCREMSIKQKGRKSHA